MADMQGPEKAQGVPAGDIIQIPTKNWHMALADAVRTAPQGATIEVHDDSMLELAKSAAGPNRLNRSDLKFQIAAPPEDLGSLFQK